MHVLPAKHSYAWLPRKCDYWTDGRTDRQAPDKVIPMCRYASQATQKCKSTTTICKSLPLQLVAIGNIPVYRQASLTNPASTDLTLKTVGLTYLPAFLTNPASARGPLQISQRKQSGCQLLFMALMTRPTMKLSWERVTENYECNLVVAALFHLKQCVQKTRDVCKTFMPPSDIKEIAN